MTAVLWSIQIAMGLIAVSALAYSVSLYEIEAKKQESIMMKVCIDAGRDWSISWNRHVCLRTDVK